MFYFNINTSKCFFLSFFLGKLNIKSFWKAWLKIKLASYVAPFYLLKYIVGNIYNALKFGMLLFTFFILKSDK